MNRLRDKLIQDMFKIYKSHEGFSILVTVNLPTAEEDLGFSFPVSDLSAFVHLTVLDMNFNPVNDVTEIPDTVIRDLLEYRKCLKTCIFPECEDEHRDRYIAICESRYSN
ncbi:MAG: hypothetical protein ACRC6V_04050 [Bacteroidales bacterium]